ncbi:MAG: hypothetical protein IJ204_05495 [Paludibacteraceae bacterium]|nr:hypothetical protein [Paludibacteraceae bacterium]
MRRYICYILVCMSAIVSADLSAVTLTSQTKPTTIGAAPAKNAGPVPVTIGSTSAAINGRGIATTGPAVPAARPQSFSAISASNFATLNAEGGACSLTSAETSTPGPRKRPGTGTGVVEERSPVGDTPWLFVLILATAFACLRFLRSRQRA